VVQKVGHPSRYPAREKKVSQEYVINERRYIKIGDTDVLQRFREEVIWSGGKE